jgi:3-deoxy-D-manno-octulosonate 8-phosphate phosphatase (KDO 8-P phosphatase)
MIKLVILDVDGCLCDGKIYDKDHNVTGKIFNDLDFSAIKLFKAVNIPVVLLTSDNFNQKMSIKRQISFFDGKILGRIEKLKVYEKIKETFDVTDDECVYLGDDRFDLPVLEKVKWAFCPSNSPAIVKNICTVLKGRSGQNLVSEIFDWFLESKILKEPSLDRLAWIDLKDSR